MYVRQKQRGVVLLTLLLVIMAAGSFVLLKALNVAADNSSNDKSVTRAALTQAKLALIGYAVNTPELTNANLGPGRLPCPDLTSNGSPALSCSLSGVNPTTGWFPYSKVGTGRLKDASGADLWYAVAESHRNFLDDPINSDTGDTTDDLSVDGRNGILAVIIAPGPPIAGQVRSGSLDIADYLELDNVTLGDATFTGACNDSDPTRCENTFNDQVITVTRVELMAAVEKRVLGEVSNRLKTYFDLHTGFPWLSEFADPSTAKFKGSVGTIEGQLPFHYIAHPAYGDPNAGPNETNYESDLTISWNLVSAIENEVETGDPDNSIPPACLALSDCIDPDFGPIALNALAADTDCEWWDADPGTVPPFAGDYIRCIANVTFDVSKDYLDPPGVGSPLPGILTRTYEMTTFFQDADSDLELADPTGLSSRTRTISTDNPADSDLSSDEHSITFTITQTHSSSMKPDRVDQWIITAGSSTDGTVTVAGVQYDLDVDAGELPGWVIENDWHHLLYFAYSDADSPVSTSTCDIVGPCITLRMQRTSSASVVNQINNRGLVLIAGRDISGSRPSGNLADYFESENDQIMTPNDVFAREPFSTTFNDQIRSIGTAP